MSDPGISRPLGRSSSCVAEGLRPSCPRPLWRSSSSVAEGLRPSWGSERSGGSELTASDVTGEACDVFISFRFGGGETEARALKVPPRFQPAPHAHQHSVVAPAHPPIQGGATTHRGAPV